jgi:hypothetical protein
VKGFGVETSFLSIREAVAYYLMWRVAMFRSIPDKGERTKNSWRFA